MDAGLDAAKLRHVPLGVDATVATDADVARVRAAYGLPSEHLLFVGTLEPRKNLRRLQQAHALLAEAPPLVIVGADGWGDRGLAPSADRVRFLGFVPAADLARSTRVRRRSAIRACARGSACPCWRRWSRARPS